MLDVSAGDVEIERLSSAGQRIVAPRPLFASLAGRGDWIAVVVAVHPVGVDVETLPVDQPMPLDLLHPREREAVLGIPEPDRGVAVARFWTAREAYCKATGRGLPNDLASIEARDDPAGEGVLLIENGKVRAIAALTITDDYVVAVVELAAAG